MSPTVSFEFFPPRDLAASFTLWETAQALLPFAPTQVSVTYGAGGTTRDLTHDTVVALQAQGANVAAHLTCVGATKAETLDVAARYQSAGVTDIVALRGDMPNGAPFQAHPEGFETSLELISALSDQGLKIQVGAYPDGHPDAESSAADIEWLRQKFQSGAKSAITQFFFDADTFLRFRDACADAGLNGAIIPGILPIHEWKKARSFAKRCGTSVPADLNQAFETAMRQDRHDLLALTHTSELCTRLIEEGVDHLHFYTLNRPDLTRDVLRALGCPAQTALRNAA